MSRKKSRSQPADAKQQPAEPLSAAAAPGLRPQALLAAVVVAAVVALGAWYALTHREEATAGSTPLPGAATDATRPGALQYVGSPACARCHADESQAWRQSQHAVAMQHASADTVLGDFDDASFTYQGVTSTFKRSGGRWFVRTDGPDGQLADFEVKYTFGVAPLQQYLVELPGGRLQALAITWDTRPREQGGQRWFRQYPDEDIDHTDELHWTRRAQNWNYMCADCHSTQVRKGYDAKTDSFTTTFTEISVGCEACHGPGAAHVRWASSGKRGGDDGLTVKLDERHGVTWNRDAAGKPVRSVPRASEREIEVCAQCHARRAQIAESYVPGKAFMDHYLPSLLTPTLYHADGQQQDEVFIWGSWLQSRMHAAGVTCSDCHDPHTQELRAPGNAVCAQCHEPSRYDAAAHHHHEAGTAGAQCANCHMPQTTYMVVDPRRDHSLRVPRPDESVRLGVPNACNACHADRDARWAAQSVRAWLGRDAVGYQSFAGAFHDAASGEPAALERLGAIAGDTKQPPIVRASALARLAGSGHFTRDFALKMSGDPSPLVRMASVQLTEVMPPEVRPAVLGSLLGDATRAVRIEAARALAGAQDRLPQEWLPKWQQAAQEYVATLEYTADRPESRVALGGFKAALGEPEAARRLFDEAIKLDESFVPAYVNGADLLRMQGNDAEAAAMLQRGLRHEPMSATLHHALGLARIRLQQTDLALGSLRRAVELDPETLRYSYVYAVALHSTGDVDGAISRLQAASRRWPYDRDLLMGLASFQLEAGRRGAAQATARRLVAAYPDDPQVAVLAARALGDGAER